jgi:hypothetical protein
MVIVLCTLFARKWESCQVNMASNALQDLSSYKKKWNKLTWMTKNVMDHIWGAFVDYG